MNIKNIAYNNLGGIDLEFEHPVHGWIPFTATPGSSEDIAHELYNKIVSGEFGKISPAPPIVEKQNTLIDNKIRASFLLSKTDWVNQPDVYDTSLTVYLKNREEFLLYRSIIREIIVNPVEGNLDWPIEPKAIWSK